MIKWSTTHRSIVMLISFFVLLGGALLYGGMERQENPSISSPVAIVKCIYPGGSPEDIEKTILKPLEDKIGEMSDIKRTDSYAMDSIGIIKVKLKDMSDDKINENWDTLKEKVEKAQADLPAEAYKADVDTDFTDPYGVLIAISSSEYQAKDIQDVGEMLKAEIEKDPGVRAADIFGEIDKNIEINIDMQKSKQYGISPLTMVKAMKARNINIPSGNLELSNIKVPIHVSGEYADMDEIENTIIGVSQSGTPVYLKNIANIEMTDEKAETLAMHNGEPSIILGIKYAEKENMVTIKKRLDTMIDKFVKEELYADMNLEVITDQASFVQTAIGLFEENLLSAIALVVIVVLLAMGIRSAIVVSSSIPIIIAIVFIYMKFMEIPLHQVSIASLIIALSLLVANGIVANDSIYLYMEKGYDRKTACIMGVNEVKIPILTSTLTTIASFLPLAMMVGSAGKFVNTLPILVSVSLIGSLLTSLTLVPAMGYTFLRIHEKKEKKPLIKNPKFKKYEKYLSLSKMTGKVTSIYKSTLRICLGKPKLMIAISIAMLALSSLLIPSLGVQLFPPVERDQYYIDVVVQDGSTTENTRDITSQIVELLDGEEKVSSVLSMVGEGMPQYYITFTSNLVSSNKAQLLVNGSQSEINNIQKKIETSIPGAKANIRRLELAMPVDYPVQVRVSGPETDKLQEISEEIKTIMETIPGNKNIDDNYGLQSYKLNIKVNEEKANMVGLTNYDISSTVRMAINGLEVTKLKQDDIEMDDLPVVMRLPEAQKDSSEALDQIFFTSSITGKNVSLRDIADIEKEASLNKISRKDGKRTITTGMFMRDGFTSDKGLAQLEEKMADFELPKGYSMEFGGDNEERNDAFTSMIIPSILAIVMIYLILVMQFGDLREPFIIMGTIPLSFIGIIWGLKITGYPIGFMALLGAISLMGVVVNNGIVLLDYIKLVIKDSSDMKEAIIEACSIRIRPIMIGMVTTVISLIPLAVSGGALWAPMATAIISGMVISSFLTLYIIPCAYICVEGEASMLRRFTEYLRSK
ncbi:MAG: efflux RND transporter permease subunit [Proteocatella sp.]